MRSIYPRIGIKEYIDTSGVIGNKVYDPEGYLVLHVYDFDPLLEAGIDENCKGIVKPVHESLSKFYEKSIEKYKPLIEEFW